MKAKRILAALITTVMLFVMLPTTAFAVNGIAVTVENAEVVEGTPSVAVKINVTENPGVSFLNFSVGYDSNAMTLKAVDVGSVFAANEIIPGNLADNPYVVNASTYTADKTGTGMLVTLNFDVSADCASGEYNITLTKGTLGGANNLDEQDVELVLTNGSVTITEKPKEDMQGLTFTDDTVTYDGTAKALEVAGTLPQGAEVAY
ncbi:MAG: hypothetical protein IJF32_11320, partial [Oscillospiraceae bacterium]|nr:hypothetical protein [Oscillospiraceae bacterium]